MCILREFPPWTPAKPNIPASAMTISRSAGLLSLRLSVTCTQQLGMTFDDVMSRPCKLTPCTLKAHRHHLMTNDL